jgi:hypothetical protein
MIDDSLVNGINKNFGVHFLIVKAASLLVPLRLVAEALYRN